MSVAVYTNPGIGDAYWALMKILPHEEVDLKVVKCAIYRSHFLGQLKGVRSVEEFDMSPKAFTLHAASLYGSYSGLAPSMYMDMNTYLETGARIENYMPNAFKTTTFNLEWELTKEGGDKAKSFIVPGMKNVIIYTSSARNNTGGSAAPWTPRRWHDVIADLYRKVPYLNLVWIGAYYDTDILPQLDFPQMKVMIAESPEVVIQLLSGADCFITYQSGLSILAVCNSIPTYMLYFNKLDKLRWSWCPPEAVSNRNLYAADLFGDINNDISPIADWVIERTR